MPPNLLDIFLSSL